MKMTLMIMIIAAGTNPDNYSGQKWRMAAYEARDCKWHSMVLNTVPDKPGQKRIAWCEVKK